MSAKDRQELEAERERAREELARQWAETKRNTREAAPKLVLLLAAIAFLVFVVLRDSSDPVERAERAAEAAARAASRAEIEAETSTAALCEMAVLNRLRDPAGADFEFGMTAKVEHNGLTRHSLRSYVDTTTVFGAAVRQPFLCTTEGSGPRASGYRGVHDKKVEDLPSGVSSEH